MAFSYTYTNSTDFTSTSTVNPSAVEKAVVADATITTVPSYSNFNNSEDFEIFFPTALSAGEKTALDSLISAYVYTAPPTEGKPVKYGAFVSNDENFPGDYTTIAAAFTAGHKSVFVKNGFYIETADIVIPDNGHLIGETKGGVFVHFDDTALSVKIENSPTTYVSAGTVALTNGSTTVTGTSTAFITDGLPSGSHANLSEKYYILICARYSQIASVESETSLTLFDGYNGISLSTLDYNIQAMKESVKVSNVTICYSSTTALSIKGVKNSVFENVKVINSTNNINIEKSSSISFDDVTSDCSVNSGIKVTSSASLTFQNCSFMNNGTQGLEIVGPNAKNIKLENCSFENNGSEGVKFGENGCCGVSIIESMVAYNNSIGINTVAHAMNKSHCVSNCKIHYNNGIGVSLNVPTSRLAGNIICYNSGDGIDVEDSDNIISGNIIENNTGAGINVGPAGGDCCNIIENLVKINTTGGIYLNSGHHGNIMGNEIKGCTGFGGLMVEGTTDRLRVIGNCIMDNTGNGITIGNTGTNCIFSNNIVNGNSNYGLNILDATVSGTVVTGNVINGNTTSDYTDSGTGTVVSANITA